MKICPSGNYLNEDVPCIECAIIQGIWSHAPIHNSPSTNAIKVHVDLPTASQLPTKKSF